VENLTKLYEECATFFCEKKTEPSDKFG
jgi:hypothetical protein